MQSFSQSVHHSFDLGLRVIVRCLKQTTKQEDSECSNSSWQLDYSAMQDGNISSVQPGSGEASLSPNPPQNPSSMNGLSLEEVENIIVHLINQLNFSNATVKNLMQECNAMRSEIVSMRAETSRLNELV